MTRAIPLNDATFGECPETTLEDLSARAAQLLDELRQFQEALSARGKQHQSEIRVFRRGVESEAKSLQTIRNRRSKQITGCPADVVNDGNDRINYVHALNSSNLPFYEAVWRTAKTCQRIVGLGRRISSAPSSSRRSLRGSNPSENRNSATIDIIANDGLKWIKVSTVNNKRLLFEMAKQGWENYGDFSSDEEDGHDMDVAKLDENKENNQLELMKTANIIMQASRAHRVNFKHPDVQFVLPNVRENEHEDVDALLQELRTAGIQVICDSTFRSDDSLIPSEVVLDTKVLESLIPNSPLSALALTQVVNIDCTILLALISDISHVAQADLPPQPNNRSGTYHKAIMRQIEGESKQALLPHEIYPILERRSLHATSPATDRMFKIVDTMGTDLERKRAAIFFGQDMHAGKSAHELNKELQHLSCHPVPGTLLLPIKVVDFDNPMKNDTWLPSLHHPKGSVEQNDKTTRIKMSQLDLDIARKLPTRVSLSTINTSVFLYGWSRDMVTLTSNKVVATSINKAIDELLNEHEHQHEDKHLDHIDHLAEQGGPPANDSSIIRVCPSDNMAAADTEESPSQTENANSPVVFEFVGPKMYICETARSLIGKEKQQQQEK